MAKVVGIGFKEVGKIYYFDPNRYQVKVDKDSGIKNDPNDWGLEHNNPRYILDLILSIITVSMATNEIVKRLPKLDLK